MAQMRYIRWNYSTDMGAELPDITGLLHRFRDGDKEAETELLETVYTELRRIAVRRLSHETDPHLLQPTALISEAYLRLVDQQDKAWANRQHFFAVCAEIMRHVLIDDARRRKAQKREGILTAIPLRDDLAITSCDPDQIIEIDTALKRLAEFDERQARIVELQYFAGLSHEEIASELSISTRTVRRELNLAKAWLHGQIRGGLPSPPLTT